MEIGVIWLQGAGCTGCSVSLLNLLSPPINDVITGEVVPGKEISLIFHPTIMASSGSLSLGTLEGKRDFVLVVEGSVPEDEYCEVGGKSFRERLSELSRDAVCVIAFGTCSSYGGIPSGSPSPTKSVGVSQIIKDKPVINIPGCPPHPEWFLGTVAHIVLFGIPELDEVLRPKLFFERTIHENCPKRAYYDEMKFARSFGEDGCLYELGCKGPYTHADCPLREWNGGVNWCIANGSPCIGCTEPFFPDGLSPFYEKLKEE